MAWLILFTLTILICDNVINAQFMDAQEFIHTRQRYYWQIRWQLMMNERRSSLGGQLELNSIELIANKILMSIKSQEIHEGFISNNFLPSRNFLEVVSEIEKSEVFKILREMPKGALLHAHESALVSLDYKLNNVTYRENLYMCDQNDSLKLKFFKNPDETCDWQLLSEVRRDLQQADTINDRIRRSLTMITENPRYAYNTIDKAWGKFNSIFKFMNTWLSYRPIFEDVYYRVLQELYEDNVMYAEIRSTLTSLYDFDRVYGSLEMAGILKNVTDKFVRDYPDFLGVKIIYAPQRSVNETKLDKYLKTLVQLTELYPNFVIGFDLVGQEDKGGPLIKFADKLNAVNPEIKFFFHAGETNWNGMSTDFNLFDALLLNPKRIGHGYALTKHPLLWNFVQLMGIAVEICPISNQVLSLVENLQNHPATTLFALGSPVVISSDDPGLWGAKGLSYDFYEAFMGLMSANSDLRSLKQLAMNSLIYSSMNSQEKNDALIRWQRKWDAFINKLVQPFLVDNRWQRLFQPSLNMHNQ
ncbi:adenosine deaminase 2-like [Cataglyphis hispanica]|uniref:adenosine deaminase 2-like n=1 Tax=Cataglyphis hispanica TaxID=1086592 RepID=UPI0021800A5A|nr:adenosine deaminase 2-like [Cataglyphis hispanica]